jgi:molecular chaperone Hsp33
MPDPDTLQRFLFEDNAVRGELVHLDATYRAIRDSHDYPPPVRALLGETLAASALLSGSIKAHDSLIVQVQASGPVHLVVAQCTSQRSLRGLARWTGAVEPGGLQTLCGTGTLAITIDPGRGQERYQGLVALSGESVAQAIETYFEQSEQLPTRLWLACDGERAAGLLVQSLPGQRADPDAWNRIQLLAATVRPGELLDSSLDELRRTLFPEEDVRVFDPQRTTYHCTCARETIGTVLASLGRAELEEALDELGELTVTCEFCNRRYVFDRVDVEAVLAGEGTPAGSSTRH